MLLGYIPIFDFLARNASMYKSINGEAVYPSVVKTDGEDFDELEVTNVA